jgi:hypothetical protein
MTKTINATAVGKINYSYTDSTSTRSVVDSNSADNKATFTYGTGNLQVNMVARATGILSSGGTTTIDVTALSVNPLGVDYNVDFSGIKSIVISNDSTVEGYNFTVAATGSNGLTDMFNGGSGNLSLKPYGSYIYTDPFAGITVSPTNKDIQLIDGGSGVQYSVTVLGIVS